MLVWSGALWFCLCCCLLCFLLLCWGGCWDMGRSCAVVCYAFSYVLVLGWVLVCGSWEVALFLSVLLSVLYFFVYAGVVGRCGAWSGVSFRFQAVFKARLLDEFNQSMKQLGLFVACFVPRTSTWWIFSLSDPSLIL